MRTVLLILLLGICVSSQVNAQSRQELRFEREVSNDSLLRWEQWRDLGEWSSRQFDRMSWSLGGLGRSTAIYGGWATPNTEVLRWNGVLLNNPITGQFNPAEVPFDQIGSATNGNAVWNLYPRRYAVSKPLTFVRYEQGKEQARVLDAELALPVSKKINLQASYQGIKEDGTYARSQMIGRRSTGQAELEIGSRWRLSPFWLYQGAEMDESLGYVFEDPADFSFDRFRAQARSGNTRSMRRFLLTGMRLHTEASRPDEGISMYRKLHRFEWRGPNAHMYRSSEWGLSATQALVRTSVFELKPFVDLSSITSEQSLVGAEPERSLRYRVGSNIGVKPVSFMLLHGSAEAGGIGDQSGFGYEMGIRLMLPYGLDLDAELMSSGLPRHLGGLQAQVGSSGGEVEPHYVGYDIRLGRYTGLWRYGLGYRYSVSDGDLWMKSDRSIEAITSLKSQSLFARLEYHSTRWETGVMHRVLEIQEPDYVRESSDITNEQRFQVYGFWKSAVISSAAFVKIGFVYTRNLNEFRAPIWLAEHGLWVNGSNQNLPAYDRLDLEIAARVRSMILTAKLENTLDGWTQKGYFEALPYPAYGRQLRLGLKVIFRD